MLLQIPGNIISAPVNISVRLLKELELHLKSQVRTVDLKLHIAQGFNCSNCYLELFDIWRTLPSILQYAKRKIQSIILRDQNKCLIVLK